MDAMGVTLYNRAPTRPFLHNKTFFKRKFSPTHEMKHKMDSTTTFFCTTPKILKKNPNLVSKEEIYLVCKSDTLIHICRPCNNKLLLLFCTSILIQFVKPWKNFQLQINLFKCSNFKHMSYYKHVWWVGHVQEKSMAGHLKSRIWTVWQCGILIWRTRTSETFTDPFFVHLYFDGCDQIFSKYPVTGFLKSWTKGTLECGRY